MKDLWTKFPVWLKALLIGVLLFFPIISVNQILLFQNLAKHTSLPWSLPIIIMLLWFYWRFTTGSNGPFKFSAVRQDLSRSRIQKSGNMMSIVLSIVGLMLFTYSTVSVGYAFLDGQTDQQAMIKLFSAPPAQTAIPLILGLSLTAGIVEEVVFRGYVQTMLERSYGVAVSFIATAIIFALIHFLPTILLVPYICVSLTFSYVAYRSRSIIPGVVAHASFDFIAIVLIYYNPIMMTKEFFVSTLSINILVLGISGFLLWYSQHKFHHVTEETVDA